MEDDEYDECVCFVPHIFHEGGSLTVHVPVLILKKAYCLEEI